jgi:uncharacterized protein
MPEAFSDADLDRLEAYLRADHRIDAALPLDAIQGLFAAISSTTAPVPRERWLPEVLGDSHAFESPEDADEILGLLERFREDTERQLRGDVGFDFILYGPEGDEEDLAAWADGYLIGVELAEPSWESQAADSQDLDDILYPFLVLTGQARTLAEENGEEWMGDEEEAKMIADIREGLADHLHDVREYWFERAKPQTQRREEPKVGRNDPCPCGSGKKYKHCHGG